MDKILGVSLSESSGRLVLKAPYLPAFPARARALGGRWDGAVWAFDSRDEARVRALCLELYGTDGEETETVEVLVRPRLTRSWGDKAFYGLGRQLAYRATRDARVALGDGVTLLEGAFEARGGSAKHPCIGETEGVVLLVRDVPRALAEAAIAAEPETYSLAPVSQAEDPRPALEARIARLRAELADAEAELVEAEAELARLGAP